ncbi:hypothetical protein GmRootV35_13430 [Variovorax sp. V35]
MVTVAKTATPATGSTVVAGQTLSYTLTATVTGSATTAATVLTDTLGANLTFGSVTSAGVYTAGGSGQVRTFTLPSGTAAGTYAVTYTATVNAGATGTVNNAVTGATCTASGVCTTSHPIGAVTLTKALAGESGTQAGIAEAGETLTYTITLANPSTVAVTGYALTDTLSAGLTYVSSTNGGVNAGQSTTWTGLTIPASGSLVVTVVAKVNTPIATSSINNIAKKTGDPDPSCPSTGCVVTPTASTVTVAKTATPATGSTVVAGQTISYTLTATVTGSATTAATVLTDTLGANLTFGSVTSAGVYTAGGSGQVRTFTLPSGTAAGTYAVTYTATVNAGATGTVNNAVTGATCTASGVCTTSHPIGAVTLTKALAGESGTQAGIAEAGETLTYTITLANPSTVAVTGYALTDTLSAGLTYVSSTNGGVNAGQSTTWTGLTIPASGSLVVTVVATVNTPIASSSINNIAKKTGDPDPSCPSTGCVVTPTASTVTVAKTATPATGSTVVAGQTISYTLTATVTGSATTAATVLTDTLGANLTFGSVTSAGVYTAGGSGQVRTFTLPSGTAAGTYAVTYTATVNAGATGTVNNAVTGATCTASGVCTTSHPIGAVTLTKALAGESGTQAGIAEAGETLTYTITLANPSTVAVTGYALTDTLSAGLTYVSSTNGGVNAGQSTTWTGLTIPASGSLVVTVVATVNTPIASSSINNIAKKTGDPDPSCPSTGCVVTPTASTVTVAKTATPATGSTVVAGQTLSYTLTATVTGSATTAATVLTDTLGANLTFGSVTSAGVYTAGGSGQVRTFTLPSGTAAGTYAVTYTATVNAGATGTVNNAVTGATCTASGVCTTSHPIGAVTLTKALAGESGTQAGIAEAGETLTYTITLANPSTVAVTGYALTDTLSAGLTYVSSTNGGVNAGQSTTWTGLTIPASGSLVVTVVATVNTPIASSSINNIAKKTGDPDPSCPSTGCVVTPTASTVTVAKTATPATGSTVVAGQTLSYTLTATVTGSATTAATVLTDTLGANLTFGSVTSAGVYTAGGSGQVRTFTLPSGTAAGTYAVTYTATVNAGATGTVNNAVTGATCTASGVCTTSHPIGAVTLTKALAGESGTQAGIAEAGETLTYTITLANPSTVAVTGYALTDTLSAGLTYVSSTNGGVNAGQSTTWTGLTIPASGSLVVTVVAKVNTPIATSSINNIAKKTGDPDPSCPSTGCVVTPTASTVTVAKTATPATGSTVVAGQTLSYTLTATVTGSATTAATVLTDTLGANLTFGSVTSAGVYTAGGSGQVRTFTLPSGTAAGTYAVTYTATVNAGATGTVNNAVTGATCTASGVCTTSHPIGAVTLTKALAGESGTQAGIAEAGETLTYTITLANPSTVAVTGYALTDTLSAGLTYVSSTNGGVNAGQSTTWTGLTIPASGSLVVTVVATVNTPIASSSINNIAKKTGDPDPSCPSTGCVVTPTASTVTVAKTATPATGSTVVAGQTLSYTLTATVTGSATTAATVLTDTLGANLTFGSVTSAGVYTAGGSGQVRTFTLPSGTAAGTYAVTYTATVNAGATGTVNNAVTGATCTASGVCTTSHPIGAVTLTKALAGESGTQAGIAEAGETLTYTITLANPSTVAVTGYALTDTLSAGLTYVSSTNGGVNAGQSTTWTGLTIPASGSLVVTVVATVNTPIASSSINNIAKKTGDPDPSCPSTGCVVTPTASTVTVAKTATPATGSTVVAGQTLSYTLTATVTGSATTAATVLTDTLGANLTFGSVTSAGVYTAGGSGQVRTFTLPSGTAAGTYAVTYTATVNAGATGTVNNAVTGATCTASGVCTTSHPIGAVTLTKALAGESGTQAGIAEAGETLTYTITLANPSTVAVTGYALTDTLSAGLTYVSSTNGGVNAGQSTTWTGLTIPASGSLVVTVVATVNTPIASSSINNIAKKTGDPDPSCPSTGCVVTPTASTVTVAKTATPATGSTVVAGQTLSYTLTATVTGSATTAATVLTDTLGANLTFGSVTSAGVYTAGGSGQVRTFTLPSGTAAGTYAVTYTATVNAGATGTVNNAVTGATCTASGVCTTSHPIGAVTLTKALAGESGTQAGIAEAGETLTYTITLANPSTVAVTGYALTDTLSAGLTYVSSTNGGVNAGQSTTWTGLTIPASGSLVVTVVAKVNTPIATSSINNIAKKTGDPDPSCPSTGCVVTPTASTVTVAKTATPATGSTVVAGQTLSYTLTATVTGSATTAATVLTDTLGANLTFGSVTSAGVYTAGGSGQVRTFTLPSGTAAGTYAVTYTATVNAGATGTVNNAVTGATCTASGVCTTSHPIGAVTLTKALAGESGTQAGIAEAGETLTYTITLANPSTVAVTGYALTDTLSAGLTYVSSTNGGVNAGQSTTWTGLTIPASGSLVVTVVATVNTPIASSSINNIAKKTGDPDPSCPSTGCVVTPTASTVTVAKTATPATGSTVVAGQTISYTLTATVTGSATTAATVLTDTLGANLTFGSVTSAGVYTAGGSGQVRTFTLPSGTAAGTYAVTYTATVNAGATGTVNNAVTGATCTASGVCTTSHPIGAVTLTKALAGESGTQAGIAEAGETLTYTITLANPSTVAVTGYALTDTLSAGLTYVSSTNGGVNAGQSTTWTGLTIPASGSLVVTVVATVNTPIASSSINNIAKKTGDPDPSCPSTGCVVTPTASTVTVAKTATPATGSTVVAGQTLSYTLTATVTGSATTAATVLTDTLGANLTFGSVTSAGVYTAGGSGQVRTFTLPSGTAAGTYAVTYTATVNAGATGTVNNAVTGATCTASGVCTTSHPIGAVTLTKALAGESGTQAGIAEAGETLTYTITLANPSTVAVTGYALTDTLSAGLTYVSSTNGGVNAGQSTTWTGLTIPASGSLVVTVVATVNTPIASSSINNIAKKTGDPDPSCPSTGCVVTPTASTVTVAKTATPATGSTVVAGQTLSYTLTATVTGSATTAATVLTDTLGANLTFGSVTSAGVYTAGGSGQVRTFTLPSGTAAGTYAVTYTATVNAGATGTVNNAVTGATCTASGVCTTSHPIGAVTLTKALAGESGTQAGIAEAGETLTYTITLANPSTVAVTGYALTDTLSAGLTYVSSTNGGVNAGQSTTWTGLTIPASGSLVVTVVATVNTPIASSSINNIAKKTGDPDPSCPSTGCVVTPTASTVTVAKTATPATGSTVVAGQTISYTLTATVTGSATTAATVLTDTLGANLTFGSVTSAGVYTAGGSGQVRTFTLPSGTAAGTYAVTYTATVNAGATGTVNNAVTGATCTASGVCTTSHPIGAVTLTKALAGESGTQAGIAEAGETLTYTITLANPSTVAVTGYALTDTLSAGLTYVSSTNGGVNAGQSTTWTGLTIPASGSLVVTVRAIVSTPLTGATVRNIAKPTGTPDPSCPSAGCVETPTSANVTLVKTLSAESGAQAGIAEPGEMLTYSITLTNAGGTAVSNYNLSDTLSLGLAYVSSSNGGANSGQTTTWSNLTVPANGSLVVTLVARVSAQITTAAVSNIAKPTSTPDPACPSTACVVTPTAAYVTPLKQLTGETGSQPRVAEAGEQLTYTITLSNSGGTAFNNYRFTENVPLGATLTSVSGASGFGSPVTGSGSVTLTVASVPAGGTAVVTVVFTVPDTIPAGVSDLLNLINGGDIDPACGSACSVSIPVEIPAQLSIVKTSAVREAKVGDLVRYTLTVTNIGASNVVNARITDTPPMGFSYVAGSVAVADGDGAFTVSGSAYPIQIGGIDVAIGKQATISYLLRVGAGVRQGLHINQASAQNSRGRTISNIATAQVSVVADPLVDESLILGTVFDDRDGDGWQDPATLSGLRVQGGFAPEAYIAGSTTVDRGQGPQPEPDASAPMLHGIAIGTISGRQSEADPVENHQVVIRQRLREPSFTNDLVLTSSQGVTLRMDAAGKTTIEKSGDAAKGLNGAEPTVERRIAQTEDGYVVDYIVRNAGIDERGIPGVRIASVEGLLIETDQFGRYNLTGILGGDSNRGRNFILKVDPSTLPDGAAFTTANPLVRRITPGLPVRFDFGVKLPNGLIAGQKEQIDIEFGEVMFAPGSADLRQDYLPVVEKMAAKVNEYGGGDLVIRANGEAEALALGRVQAVEAALKSMLSPAAVKATRITARTELSQPASTVVGVQQGQILLGTVLFDTDKALIKPRFNVLLAQIAKQIDASKGGVVNIVGHADKRASDAHNMALGLRRAKAVYDAIAQQLNPEVRAKVRVETLPEVQPMLRSGRQ